MFDHELAGEVQADEVLRTVDVDADGLAELLLTAALFDRDSERLTTGAVLYRLVGGPPRVLDWWTAIEHCHVGYDDWPGYRIFHRRDARGVSFRDEPETQRCFYPPAPGPAR
ncbi:hypothetical protein [Nannocystis pusilla]|uniref:hypothetical protein n=1 Tax=Nannocystis pusilla TaxID=889268 RepID=UPI003DA28CBA